MCKGKLRGRATIMEFAKQMFHICESGVSDLPERGPQVADIGVVVHSLEKAIEVGLWCSIVVVRLALNNLVLDQAMLCGIESWAMVG
jgi:hypothetical protein